MNDRFKFRVWNKRTKEMLDVRLISYFSTGNICRVEAQNAVGDIKILDDYKTSIEGIELMQCTGLKGKNGLNLLFECDIINMEGVKIGNCYENEYLLKDTTNFIIKGMGTKEWRNSEQEAIKRGCYYAE